ncbi:MAG: peptidase [Gammaproteobacteria bacterium RIFCSPHIGHO2_12_FULL_63_22]|nr:MAG: peptidase [Gammaproteobacteria bacterium RIFCSPHIGHO2_12_FULL_63_22]
MRPILLATAIAFALGLACSPADAQDKSLPDIGSSAGELLTPAEESQYGAYTLYQLRRFGYLLEDPLIDSWMGTMGHRLGAASDRPAQPFNFFLMRDRQINAFATLGGYIGINAGIVLTAESEDEVAGVVAHEISHVTQRHVLRAVERAKKDQLPIMLATVGMIIAAQQSGRGSDGGATSSDDAIMAAVVGGQALAAQRQIDYTRSGESEADRVGIQTLFNAGYKADGMANFFERMERLTRGNSGGYNTPAYLQTHPVNTTRLSEARERAQRLQREKPNYKPSQASNANLLLPWGLTAASSGVAPEPVRMFDWARERLRVLSADTPSKALKETKNAVDMAGTKATDAQRYGLALAQMKVGYPAAAEDALQALSRKHPGNLWLGLALAENAFVAHNPGESRKRYEGLLARHPDDRAVILSFAETLNSIGGADAGKRAQAILRPLLTDNADNPLFQKNYARASELAGDLPRAGEAYAETAYLNGRAEDALNQLNALLKRSDISYIQRARIEARIAAITPEVLEMRRRRVKPQDLPADNS